MNILTLSDIESGYLWNCRHPLILKNVDLILSCGDLDPNYLSFIATYTHAPVLYVHGNHDTCYDITPPEGCICIEDRIYNFNGIRILGLGGSYRYKDGVNQYTELQMARRIAKLKLKLTINRGFDILVTHSPAYGFHDGEDQCHRGFDSFNRLINTYHPKYFVHGHVHMNYGRQFPRVDEIGDTKVINAFERYILEV